MSHVNTKRSKISFVLLTAFLLVAATFVSVAPAAEFTGAKGISFTHPAEWTATETQQGPATIISLMNPSQPMISIAVTLAEGSVPENTPLPDEATVKTTLDAALATYGQGAKLTLLTYKKTTIAGHDAVLYEYTTDVNEMSVHTRYAMFVNGTDMIAITSAYMDKSLIADGQKISEGIENSLTLK